MTDTQWVPGRAAEARDRVRDLLHSCPDALDDLALADALLVTSELVTNAQRHGGGLAGFTATLHDGHLRLVVADHSPAHPVSAPDRTAQAIGGYGWPLVRRLAARVDVLPTPGGKAIHVVLALRRTPAG
ncbi:ATP-binding protein [Streptomyces sp. NPDC020742]|uniref:ATP-binding protein n=1 Tax=unclassified Streptomyces TaxID=2593676 RepID=UPI0033EE531F